MARDDDAVPIDRAVEEILRYVSPVMGFGRLLTIERLAATFTPVPG